MPRRKNGRISQLTRKGKPKRGTRGGGKLRAKHQKKRRRVRKKGKSGYVVILMLNGGNKGPI